MLSACFFSFAVTGAIAGEITPRFKGDRDGHDMRAVIPRSEIPAAPLLSITESIGSFNVQPGFVVEPVAAEPAVFSPVALAFDASGRLWVAEMTTYMPDVQGTGEMKPEGNIVMLEDTDGDGRADQRTVFLDDVLLPRTISIVEGGIFYADQEALYFAEVRETNGRVYPGLHEIVDATYAAGGNVEHKPNGMLYGIDNWYYNANSTRRYRVMPHDHDVPAGAEEIYRNPFWKLVRGETDFRGQWGLSMDDYGRLYHNGNSAPIHGEYLLPGSLRRNPGFWPEMPAHAIGDNRVYPGRMNPGVNRGYMDGVLVEDGPDRGKLVSFTAASGSLVYRGHNFPGAYYGMALTPEPAANLVSARKIIDSEGALGGEPLFPGQELLTSTDERFRPVNLFNAPDGTIYIVDMYHGIVQHRDFLTRYLAEQVRDRELDQGNHTMGRIYRLRWSENPTAAVPDMGAKGTAELVPLLVHANAWQRDSARRLLVQRAATGAVGEIGALLAGTESPAALVNLLWTLEGLGAVDLETVERLAGHENDRVAMTAAAVGEQLPAEADEGYREVLMQLARSGYPRALQAAISASALDDGVDISRFVLDTHLDRPYTRSAVVSGLGDHSATFIASLDGPYPDPLVQDMLANLGHKRQDARHRDQLSSAGQALYDLGESLYAGRAGCAGCHGITGNGVAGLGPTFWDSGWLVEPPVLARILLHGLAGPIWVGPHYWDTPAVMPGLAGRPDISDRDLAAIATYIRNCWGNRHDSQGAFPVEVITQTREATRDRVTPFRAEDLERP